MDRWVDITFNCLPLRSITSFASPVDASPEVAVVCGKLRAAAHKHGLHNTYYLHDGTCVFHLTNHPKIGMIEFGFSGTVLTDAEDLHTLGCELEVGLAGAACDWLAAPIVEGLAESVREAVKVEFDQYIASGDLEKTMERVRQVQAASDAQGGFLGAWL